MHCASPLASWLVALTIAAPALAQPPDPPPTEPSPASTAADDERFEAARAAFDEGTELAGKERWREAREAFEKSHALRRHPLVAYNIGFCERSLGRYTRARYRLREALALESAGAGGLGESKHEAAEHLLEEVDQHLVRVLTKVSPAGSLVKVDGRPLVLEAGSVAVAGVAELGAAERAPEGVFTLLVDPGPHVIVVSYPNRAPVVVERRFDRESVETLTVVAPEPAPPPPPRIVLRSVDQPPWTSLEIAGVALLGVSGALAIVVGVTGGMALAADADLADRCLGTACPPGVEEDLAHRDRLAVAATASIVFAAAAAGVGLTLLLWPHEHPAEVALGPGGAVLRVAF